jgi:hypothetical protein
LPLQISVFERAVGQMPLEAPQKRMESTGKINIPQEAFIQVPKAQ